MVMKDYIKPKERTKVKWEHPRWLYKIIGLFIGLTLSILITRLLLTGA